MKILKHNFSSVKAILVAGALSQAAAGCASMPYPLSAVPPKPPAVFGAGIPSNELTGTDSKCADSEKRCAEFEHAIRKTIETGNQYWNAYAQSGNSSYWFDVPLLGLALAAVGGASFGAHTDFITGAGLAAAGVGAARGYVNPNESAGALLYGAQSTACVLTAAQLLRDVPEGDSESRFTDFETGIKALNEEIQNAELFLGRANEKSVGDSEDKPLVAAIGMLETEIKNARGVVKAARVEISAFRSRFTELNSANWTIARKVAERLSGSRSIDFGDSVAAIRGALVQAATRQELESVTGTAGEDDDDSSDDDVNATSVRITAADLSRKSNDLLADMPDYKGAIAAIATCPVS